MSRSNPQGLANFELCRGIPDTRYSSISYRRCLSLVLGWRWRANGTANAERRIRLIKPLRHSMYSYTGTVLPSRTVLPRMQPESCVCILEPLESCAYIRDTQQPNTTPAALIPSGPSQIPWHVSKASFIQQIDAFSMSSIIYLTASLQSFSNAHLVEPSDLFTSC